MTWGILTVRSTFRGINRARGLPVIGNRHTRTCGYAVGGVGRCPDGPLGSRSGERLGVPGKPGPTAGRDTWSGFRDRRLDLKSLETRRTAENTQFLRAIERFSEGVIRGAAHFNESELGSAREFGSITLRVLGRYGRGVQQIDNRKFSGRTPLGDSLALLTSQETRCPQEKASTRFAMAARVFCGKDGRPPSCETAARRHYRSQVRYQDWAFGRGKYRPTSL